MANLVVALLQMAAHGNDQQANLVKGEAFCRQAAEMGADIALFPEMWNIGYTFPASKRPAAFKSWSDQAVGQQDPFVLHFRSLAKQLKMAIGLTYLERWEALPRNSMSLIDRSGEIVLTYAKVHTCEFDAEAALTPGDGFYVCPLKTAKGEVQVGAMICYDREFPEPARILMLKGAEIILVPNACEMEANRKGQLRARAMENMLGVALANYVDPHDGGHSVAYSPIAFGDDEKSLDTTLIEAGEDEGVYLAEFDLKALRAWRKKEAWGNAFRRPRLYGALVEGEVRAPFKRKSATR